MTAVIGSRMVIRCCDCGGKFSIPEGTASDLSILNVTCPHCGRNGVLGKECRRNEDNPDWSYISAFVAISIATFVFAAILETVL